MFYNGKVSKKIEDEEEKELLKKERVFWEENFGRHYRKRKRKKKEPKSISFFLNILFYLGFWYGLKRFGVLGIPFVALSFSSVLPLLNFVLWFNILGNGLLIFYYQKNFYCSVRLLSYFLSLILFYRLYTLFPFEFGIFPQVALVEFGLRMALLIAVIGFGVGALLYLLELIFDK